MCPQGLLTIPIIQDQPEIIRMPIQVHHGTDSIQHYRLHYEISV